MPNVDGKGMDSPKAKTPEESLEGGVRTGKGGESKSGTWIKNEGPNAPGGKSGKK